MPDDRARPDCDGLLPDLTWLCESLLKGPRLSLLSARISRVSVRFSYSRPMSMYIDLVYLCPCFSLPLFDLWRANLLVLDAPEGCDCEQWRVPVSF